MRLRFFNLSLKLTIGLIASLALILSLVGFQNVRLHRHHLEEATIASADRISDTIKRSTRYSMLKNHRDELYHIITTIGAQPGISKIRIFNEEGRISVTTDAHELNTLVDKRAEACYACHAQEQPLVKLNRPDRIRIYSANNGERILGLINPIENEPSCYNADCHAHSPSQRVLGILDVSLSLGRVDEIIAVGQRRMIANYVGASLLVSLIIASLVWVMVHRPVKQLIVGTQRVASGSLDYKIAVSSGDEIGELAGSFNHMTSKLKQASDELTNWAKMLEVRVEEKTGELKKAHAQMIRVERMASIGKLAAIVAHEINNPLAGILTYAKLLLKKLRNGFPPEFQGQARQYLDMIASESGRCGEIVKNLLQFSRQTTINLQPNDVGEIIRQSMRLVQHKIDLMNIDTHLDLYEGLPLVVCDAQRLQQALVALLINACEAIVPGEGRLEVASHYRDRADQRSVLITVRDNGQGMDTETQKHIFEPFFTTKEQGKGVGLGLAVVYGIVHQHSGEIEVDSTPGVGTTFTIRLPENPALLVQEDVASEVSS